MPFIALDALFWQPGWVKTSYDALRARVQHALDAAPAGWVVDGNYERRIGELVGRVATDIICKSERSAQTLRANMVL